MLGRRDTLCELFIHGRYDDTCYSISNFKEFLPSYLYTVCIFFSTICSLVSAHYFTTPSGLSKLKSLLDLRRNGLLTKSQNELTYYYQIRIAKSPRRTANYLQRCIHQKLRRRRSEYSYADRYPDINQIPISISLQTTTSKTRTYDMPSSPPSAQFSPILSDLFDGMRQVNQHGIVKHIDLLMLTVGQRVRKGSICCYT